MTVRLKIWLTWLAFVSISFAAQLNAAGPRLDETVRVFILAGQSNMEGAGMIVSDLNRNQGRGTLEYLAKTQPDSVYGKLLDADGNWRERSDVWIHYFDRKGKLRPGYGARTSQIGPELGFGQVVGDHYEEPVLLIKIAWGGKSLAVDFRPPSAGGVGTGAYYKELVANVHHVLDRVGDEFPELAGRRPLISGFGWHQGWNDRINQSFNDEYESNLTHFINDIRLEFGVPNLPFVIAETGMSGVTETHPRALSLMQAQANVAQRDEFKGNVAFVGTKAFFRSAEESPSGQAYHWNSNAETYYLIGEAMGHAMIELMPKPEL